ncbi:TetR/AcrR family transcriptional regulator [Tessaracoccus sp. OS52]|uniref:TetR/AcrR family transcriptional regulator n=1 Tax=Tessaracoccus sp. OS52 TaxID=2886691 RepID=UPI001D1283DC|nr:TetR/AcrR family transcriptional regulator [Tessaracoccus sp. OS52]MCC2593795.1 TetR/AcrR family transcriptional regulator [Tessaracoccus sp. OS52]
MAKGRRGPRGDIDRDLIVEAARAIVERDGASALSLRAVAAEAGVAPNAVYTYVADMRDLTNAVADAFIGTWDLTLLDSAAPREAAASFIRQVWDQFTSHPGQADLLGRYRVVGVNSLALQEALLGFLTERAGLGLAHAASGTYLLTAWLHGRALLRASDDEDVPAGLLTGLDPAEIPLTLAASRLPTGDLDELELLLDALGLR